MMYLWFIPVALILIVLLVIFYRSTTKSQPTPANRDVFHSKEPDSKENP